MSLNTLFQSTWSLTNCAGAPNAMYIFTETNTTKAYTFVTKEYTLPTCGNNPKEKPTACCYSSLDTEASIYQSIAHQFIKDTSSPLTNAPLSSNGFNYCHLTANGSDSLLGLKEAFYLNDGICYDSKIKCTSNGFLQFYPEDKCTGAPQEFKLNSTSNQIRSSSFGTVNAKYTTISSGAQKYDWTAFTPSAILIPNYSVTLEYIENASFFLGCLGSIGIIVYLSYKYSVRKTDYMLWLLVSQIIWALWVFMDAVYYNMLFSSDQAFQYYSQVKNMMLNLATLATVLNTSNFISTFLRIRSKTYKYLLFVMVVVIHLLLTGGKYFDYYRLTMGVGNIFQRWNFLSLFWIILMFVYNTSPSFFVTTAILKADKDYSSSWNALLELQRVDKKFSILVLIQFINSITYFVMAATQTYTEYLRNDRNYLAINGPIDLCFVIHSAVNCLFIEHVRIVLKIRSQLSDSKSYNTQSKSIYNDTNGSVFKDGDKLVKTNNI
ncbi:hypothetical protein HDV02_006493 [Globomyces sp. JEL0801]|nr:hypothetical protein HDV02_006493 [Globomyces sp. JEL0801]